MIFLLLFCLRLYYIEIQVSPAEATMRVSVFFSNGCTYLLALVVRFNRVVKFNILIAFCGKVCVCAVMRLVTLLTPLPRR